MAKPKIERVLVTARRAQHRPRDLALALKVMKVGESFLWPVSSNDRAAIALAQVLLDRQFVTRREGKTFRVGRVS